MLYLSAPHPPNPLCGFLSTSSLTYILVNIANPHPFPSLRRGVVCVCVHLVRIPFVTNRVHVYSIVTAHPRISFSFPLLDPFLSPFIFPCDSIRLSKQERAASQRSRPLFLNTPPPGAPRFWFTVSLIKQKLDRLRCFFFFFLFFSRGGGLKSWGREREFLFRPRYVSISLAQIYLFYLVPYPQLLRFYTKMVHGGRRTYGKARWGWGLFFFWGGFLFCL